VARGRKMRDKHKENFINGFTADGGPLIVPEFPEKDPIFHGAWREKLGEIHLVDEKIFENCEKDFDLKEVHEDLRKTDKLLEENIESFKKELLKEESDSN
jgi:hypothetical protein